MFGSSRRIHRLGARQSSTFDGVSRSLALLVVSAVSFPAVAEPPEIPLADARTTKLVHQRDELSQQVQTLAEQGKLAEAREVLQKVLTLERGIFGAEHEEVLRSMRW